MEYLCYFTLGVLAVIAGFALGIFMEKRSGREAGPDLRETEKSELAEEQRAFNRLLSYNRDTAYGMVTNEEMLR